MNNVPPPASPKWSSTAKLVVGLTIVGLIIALVIQFRSIIGPLILAFILAYLIHPVAARLSAFLKISWRFSVNIIYLVLVILLLGSFTLTGLAIVQQLQLLIEFVQRFINELPALVENLSSQSYRFGPFVFNLSQFSNLQTLLNQVLGVVQPILGRVGGLVGTLATSAAVTVGWSLFVIVISYFLVADAGRFPSQIVRIDVPGYNADIRRLGQELRLVWNAFLRGQLIITLLVVITYSILMLILGMRFTLGIAILAGLARFVPYVGPLTTWTVTVLVAIFQPTNYFHLQPLYYAILVVGLALLTDQVFDNLVVPRLMGASLGVHPAGVLIAAIVATNLIGIVGLVLAAPVLATLSLVGRYVLRKMLDLDPWPEEERRPEPVTIPWSKGFTRLRSWWRVWRGRK